jgi:hypothetical protein
MAVSHGKQLLSTKIEVDGTFVKSWVCGEHGKENPAIGDQRPHAAASTT